MNDSHDGISPVVASAPMTLLAYDPARRYRPSGRLNVAGLAIAFFGGLVTSIIAAALAWLWMKLRLPSFWVIPMILQGALVGGVLALLCRRANLRNVPLVMAIGIMCGLFSAACCQGVVYLYSVYELPTVVKVRLWAEGIPESSPMSQVILSRIHSAPFDSYDRMVIFRQGTRSRGYVGFMKVRGTEVWVFTVIQALIVAGMGTYIGKMSVDRPYCESCGSWFNDPFTAVRVPRAFSEPIARAIEADDVPAVASLIHQAHQERRIDMATAEAFRCPKCRRTLVRVRNDQAKLKRRDPSLGVLHYVSDEMMQALRANPVMEVEEQPATSSAVAEG